MENEKIRVVAAVVKEGDKYLCTQRCRSHLSYISEHWEFPGGKVKANENDYEALIREIREEMAWDVFVGRKLGTIEHDYPDFSIILTAYLCKGANPDDIKLFEHLDCQWLTLEEMQNLRWTEADKKILALLQPNDTDETHRHRSDYTDAEDAE